MDPSSRFSRIWYALKSRFGLDVPSVLCICAAIVCSTVYRYTGLRILRLLSLVLLAAAVAIIFGRLPALRERLRGGFHRARASVLASFGAFRARRRDREHRYCRCPQCSRMLRVPRGKGKIEISCPCGRTFFRRT